MIVIRRKGQTCTSSYSRLVHYHFTTVRDCVEPFHLAKHVIFLKSFKYGVIQNVLPMAMSKKDMVRRSSKKRAVLEELEKQAASGSGDAKKKLAKAKKKMK